MTNPFTSPATPSTSSEKMSRSSRVVRAIAIGTGCAGAILACLRFFIAMTEPIAARCEILGGVLLTIAGVLLFIRFFLKRARSKALTNRGTLLIALAFCLLGCGWLANGFITEAANRKRFNDVKTNLNVVSEALDAFEQRQGKPAGTGQ